MTVKIEVTVDELEVIMDALELEYNTWKECLGVLTKTHMIGLSMRKREQL